MKINIIPKQLRSEEFIYRSEKSVEELSDMLQQMTKETVLFNFYDKLHGEMISDTTFKLYIEIKKIYEWFQFRPFILVHLYKENNENFVHCKYNVDMNIKYGYFLYLAISVFKMIGVILENKTSLTDIILLISLILFIGFIIIGIGDWGKVRLKRTFIKSLPVKVVKKLTT